MSNTKEEAGKWISVKERLPPNLKNVLTITEDYIEKGTI